MPAAMHLTVLMSLFAVTLSADTNTSATVKPTAIPSPGGIDLSSTSPTNISSSDAETEKPTTPASTAVLTSLNVALSPSHPKTTEASSTSETMQPSAAPEASTASRETSYTHFNATPDGKPEKSSSTAYMSTTGVPKDFDQSDLTSNPGLMAVLCIFCIVVGLLLVVVTIKCIRSPRSNFERLNDVPMNKVNEESPFAQYSK